MNLPEKFLQEMEVLLGRGGLNMYTESLKLPRKYGLRVNNLKISTGDFLNNFNINLAPVPWTENGFYFSEGDRPSADPYYYAGLFYIQEPSAMLPAAILPVNPGDKVLDMCAAPGGKSTELAVKLKGEGLLVSNDISATRAKALLKNIELFGVKNACVISEDTDKLLQYAPEFFDKIMLDAPCSGEGMFRKDDKLIKSWEAQGSDYFAPIQKKLILNAADLLKEGGMMVYSTCTFAKAEDEEAIIHLLKNRPEMELVEIKKHNGLVGGFTDTAEEKEYKLDRAVRVFPHLTEGEGHFVALLRKKTSKEAAGKAGIYEEKVSKDLYENSRKRKNDKNEDTEVEHFLKKLNTNVDSSRISSVKDKLYILPEYNFLADKSIRALRNGLLLGEEKKKRFEPSTTYALTLKAGDFTNSLNLSRDDIRVDKYLKGETLLLEKKDKDELKLSDGLVLVCVDGYGLGWGKLSGLTVKNKYFKAWRKLGN